MLSRVESPGIVNQRQRLQFATWCIASCFVTMSTVSPAAANEFKINTLTEHHQGVPTVAVDPNTGQFIAVWHSVGSVGDDDWDYSIQGQRYAVDGTPLGGQFQVNADTRGRQFLPRTAVDATTGNFVVTWEHDFPIDSVGEDLHGRIFASDGTPLGDDFQINDYVNGEGDDEGRYGFPRYFPSGDFVVIWEGLSGGDGSSGAAVARLFEGDGTPQGGQFQVNQETYGSQRYPSVAVNSTTEDFLVVWAQEREEPEEGSKIVGRRFAATGAPLDDEFDIAVHDGLLTYADVAFEPVSQNFLATWTIFGHPDGDSFDVRMRRLASDGTLIGAESFINTYTPQAQKRARVVSDPAGAGDFFVSFYSESEPESAGPVSNVRLRRFSSDGTPQGDDIRLNFISRAYDLTYPDLAVSPSQGMASDAEAFVSWTSIKTCGDDDLFGASAWYAPVPFDPCALIVDGFESGDFSGWDFVVGEPAALFDLTHRSTKLGQTQ